MSVRRTKVKRLLLSLFLLGGMLVPTASLASEQTMLYDQVWKLINSKYVDPGNNHQNWYKWRKKYDAQKC